MLVILLANQIRELEFFCFGKKESAAFIQKQNRHQKNQDPIADFQSALPCLPATGCLLSFGEQEPEPDPLPTAHQRRRQIDIRISVSQERCRQKPEEEGSIKDRFD